MSTKAERKRKAAKAARRAKQQVAQNPHDEQRRIWFGVMQKHGQDTIVCIGDPESEGDSFKKNASEFFSLAEATVPPVAEGGYSNTFRLYEDGRACAEMGVKDDAPFKAWFDDVTDYFKEHLEAHHYDQNFPEHAADMKSLAEKFVREISAKSTTPVQMPEGAAINPEYLTKTIREYLENAKTQIIEGGETEGYIGWGTEDGIFLYNRGVIHPKYRFGRAVAEAAAIVNAPFIVYGGEGWMRDPKTFKRTGDEMVSMSVIAPDATVIADGWIKFRRIDCPLKFGDLSVQVFDGKRHKQFLFPKWAHFATPTTAAA